MNLKQISENIVKVSDNYAEKHSINRDNEWYILKLQEELGELTQAYLSLTNRWRKRDKTEQEIKNNFSDELADVMWHLLLLANHNNIDMEKALENKWFKYLKN